jgi:hypothetical protein
VTSIIKQVWRINFPDRSAYYTSGYTLHLTLQDRNDYVERFEKRWNSLESLQTEVERAYGDAEVVKASDRVVRELETQRNLYDRGGYWIKHGRSPSDVLGPGAWINPLGAMT